MNEIKDILVSVVIPTYSRNDMLQRAINCILSQTHQKLDIIVVDDNPSDSPYRTSTEEIMKKYASEPRIRYIQNETNMGGAAARNVGIEAARGEYIAFLDDDDEYYPTKIEKQLQVFLSTKYEKLALVYCDVEHLSKAGEVECTVEKHFRGNCLYDAIANDCIAPTSQWMAKKSALEAVGNFSIVPCKQDSTVILKLLKAGFEVDYVPEVLVKYYNFTGGVRISFGPRKVEGELLFYEACKACYDKFTKTQIRTIEYSFAERLYMLYFWQRDKGIEKCREMKRKMWRLRPDRTALFMAKRYWHKIKNKRR